MERAVILADGEVLRLEPSALPLVPPVDKPTTISESPASREQQKALIESTLKETQGRVAGPNGAAARLGLPASTLESRIRALKINKHLFRAGP